MKILWMSDSPTVPSGFGNVTRFVCAGLAASGHDVSILGWQVYGTPTTWQGCTLYPVRHDSFGADVLLTYLQKLRPDVLITLADVWWLTYIANPTIANFMHTASISWVLYYPIDGDMGNSRLPPSWTRILATVDLPIAMSAYGRDVTTANGVTPAYIPHGVDASVFCPPADKQIAKRTMGYEGRFVILSDARNQPRKLLPRTLDIFRRFASDKDDVLLHLHCDPDDPAAKTAEYYYDLRSDLALLGLEDKVRTTAEMSITTGLTIEQLAAIYQASDVHLLASWGEGFGLPTLQAAATGVVPLASDYTASRELVLGHGEAIRVRHFMLDQFGLQRALIDIDDAVNHLEVLYQDRELLATKSKAARHFAESYDWPQIVRQWHELLQNKIPKLRTQVGAFVPTSQVMLHPQRIDGPTDLVRALQTTMPTFMEGVKVTLNVSERQAGQLAMEVFGDAQKSGQLLTIPVTLPPANPLLAKSRVPGCIYLASEQDVPVVRALARIFPSLNAWSTTALDLGIGHISGEPVQAKAVPSGTSAYQRLLASSTLAIDLAGVDPVLPRQATEAGVPCIGSVAVVEQKWLWPELSLEDPSPHAACILARWMLTDQGNAEMVCAQAQQRLVTMSTMVMDKEEH